MFDKDCIFCNKSDIILSNQYAEAFYDIHPVSKGHLLIIPKNHVKTIFELSEKEVLAMHQLILSSKKMLDQKLHPDGYNVGANCGKAAGQAIMHAHIHLIPRYDKKRPKAVNQNALRVPNNKE